MEEAVTFATRFLLALVALLAAIQFVRHRERTRLDIALMLASLGVPVLLAATGLNEITWVQALSGMIVVAQPYLLLRLVEDFRPVPRPVIIAAILGMVAAWVALAVSQAPRPPIVTLSIIAYFLLFEGYAVVAFFRGARATKGVSRWRYGLAGVGSAFLAAAILVVGVQTASPALEEAVALVRGTLPVFAAIGYYLAFIPPAWLRQAWQLPEVRMFLRTVAGQPARERADRLLKELCTAASRATAGLGSVVFLWDASNRRFQAAETDAPAVASYVVDPADGPVITRAWKEGGAMLARLTDLGPAGRQLAQDLGATALLAVPIATPQQAWGTLVVLQRRGSLFPSDDLALLEILAEQSAIALDNAELVKEEERRAEEEQRLVAELEAANAQLTIANTQLEAANKELEAFAYSVSHDLRAPLRGIDGFGQALQKEFQDKLGERGLHYLTRVRANSQLMGRLIDDLLRLSRVTRSELTMREVDLSAIASDIAEVLQRQDPEREVRFRIQDGVEVRGDPGLLRIALENLLGNAWKFTSKHPSATIEFGADRDGGAPVYFVRDDGAGFEMEYVDKLFGPFQRLHADPGFDGTGIGLATVQRIVARHGGQIWAEGAVEQGATFFFTLAQRR